MLQFHNAEGTPHCGVRFSQKTTLINNESNISDGDRSRTPPPKPKRTSSPFARVLNRLSMSRKHFNSASNEHIHEISPETVQFFLTPNSFWFSLSSFIESTEFLNSCNKRKKKRATAHRVYCRFICCNILVLYLGLRWSDFKKWINQRTNNERRRRIRTKIRW